MSDDEYRFDLNETLRRIDKTRRANDAEDDLQRQFQSLSIDDYTINGLPGPSHMKSCMYEAENLKDFKKKILSYEIQFAMTKNEVGKSDRHENSKEKAKDEERKPICYNCGDNSHLQPDCPSKDIGPKCFKCNSFGHNSFSCVASSSINIMRSKITVSRKAATTKLIKINGKGISASFDTGSDYTVIREDMFEKFNIQCNKEILNEKVKGVGGTTNLKGKFRADIKIDDNVF